METDGEASVSGYFIAPRFKACANGAWPPVANGQHHALYSFAIYFTFVAHFGTYMKRAAGGRFRAIRQAVMRALTRSTIVGTIARNRIENRNGSEAHLRRSFLMLRG